MGWREKADRAKRLHRPSLKNWARDGMAWSFPRFVESLNKRNYETFIPGLATDAQDSSRSSSSSGAISVPAILDANTTSVETFQQQYEARGIPSVIRGIPERRGGRQRGGGPIWNGSRTTPTCAIDCSRWGRTTVASPSR